MWIFILTIIYKLTKTKTLKTIDCTVLHIYKKKKKQNKKRKKKELKMHEIYMLPVNCCGDVGKLWLVGEYIGILLLLCWIPFICCICILSAVKLSAWL